MSKNTESIVTEEAYEGRLPVLDNERIYKSYFSLLATYTSLQAATWAFLVGSFLPFAGNTLASIFIFTAGTIVSLTVVTLALGPSATKYGAYCTDISKTALGSRGSWFVVANIVLAAGWGYVVLAITARAVGNLVKVITGAEAASEPLIVICAIILTVLTYFIVIKGPKLFERANKYVAPILMTLGALILVVLIVKFGKGLFITSLPLKDTFAGDTWTNYLFAFEFGMAWGLSSWIPVSGFSRLLQRQKHLIGPSVLGTGVFAGGFLCGVAALGAAVSGYQLDATIWMSEVGGSALGIVFLIFVIVANIPTMAMVMYFTGISCQHVTIARGNWAALIAVIMAPCLGVAFFTDWLIAHVSTWLTYTGLAVTGVIGVLVVDYFILRRGDIDLRSVFTTNYKSKYYFWGGINWFAFIAIACGTTFSLWLYNPVTMAVRPMFRFLGSSIPTLIITTLLYYVFTRLIAVPLGKGSYTSYSGPAQKNSAAEKPLDDAEVTF